jgi:hypothetical protein
MIDVKEAVSRAVAEAKNLYAGQILSDIQLEEVEITEDEKFWLITLGFYIADPSLSPNLAAALAPKREYKVFKIDRMNGNFVSMRIRVA